MSLFSLALALTLTPPGLPQTAAERTRFAETTSHADVLGFCDELAKRFPVVNRADFGTTGEGRPLPLLVLSDPPATAPGGDKPVVLVFANIHAGEVDGKEAVLALARDLAAEGSPLLKRLTVLVVPNLNPDGNERLGGHRPDQNGPPRVGVRTNAAGLDLNRDFVKLESPEVRALVRLINRWQPLVTVDCHTTNGSPHRYTLTHDGPRHPAAGQPLLDFAHGTLLPDVARALHAGTGFDSFPYGNFAKDRTRWETYPAQPRYGIQYLAARGQLALLSESYTHAPFADRVNASYGFVKGVLEATAEHADAIRKLPKPAGPLPLRTRTVTTGPATVKGFAEVRAASKPAAGDTPKDYSVELVTTVEPTLSVPLPAAYLIPPGFPAAVETLQRHGVKLDELHEDLEVSAEGYTVTSVKKAGRPYQGHAAVTVEVEPTKPTLMAKAGSMLVKTDQPLSRLAGLLLEPQSEDGLTTWNLFDTGLAVGKPFPVLRLVRVPDANAGPATPLPDDRPKPKPITLDARVGGEMPGRRGGGEGTEWLDAEHYLSRKGDVVQKVAARTGKAAPWLDPALLKQSLAAVPDLKPGVIAEAVRTAGSRLTKDKSASLVEAGGEYLVVRHDGSPATRFNKTGGGKQHLSLSPDGRFLGYVVKGDLYRVAAGGETARLTTDGGGDVLNGAADWVYEEEIFSRNGKAYWWGPKGELAFLRFDDSPVQKFTLTKFFPARGELETYPYPKPGDPNPTVRLGVATPGKGGVTWLSLDGYPPEDTLISRVGWRPDGVPFAYVQNRTQTWLDFSVWPDQSGKPVKLFRETTKAWVEDLGEPHWLPGGEFLVLSERSGWKHAYRYSRDGKLLNPVTAGDWEVQAVARVDADGTVFVTGTKDTPTGSHLYRTKLDGGGIERVTPAGGTHRVVLAPSGPLSVDRFADEETPTQTVVRSGAEVVRTLDSNPLPDRDKYVWGRYERVKIPCPDGFVLEGAITYPPDFDPKKVYPVWVQTYAGPHAPTVRDGWSPRIFQQTLAANGIIAFQVDPRSASGKGAVSAWACYKQLGIPELKDLEAAVAWLTKNSWADAKRVGLSGHSYGGFMTAYAMTHSKLFAAGISGAPPTDWRLYDTIYTERYMGLPSENKEGYDKTSVVKAAGSLHGKLLLVHGLMDDNVHFQNTVQLIDALQAANKDFELMVYPKSRHGPPRAAYERLQLAFIKRSLGVP